MQKHAQEPSVRTATVPFARCVRALVQSPTFLNLILRITSHFRSLFPPSGDAAGSSQDRALEKGARNPNFVAGKNEESKNEPFACGPPSVLVQKANISAVWSVGTAS